ncbi:MAG TPA: hemerythrin family protein [Sedimenticola thiotaurini]|uniref:Hemerythrin family protein n=1 Tax=Sedimenticola thiotaurini TaxID=1543721 RepID=A0A831WA14_9GAMM|nr:hemerythrin family protein [Sedimenticola thiotaurini]
MRKRKLGQKIAMIVSMICYAAAVVTVAAVGWWGNQLGANHPVVGSLAASVVFFVGVGVVLQVMGSISIPDLRVNPRDRDGT